MQRVEGKLVYAATDLVRFLACRHATSLDLTNLDTPLKKAEDDEGLQLIQNLGHQHEANYLKRLKAEVDGGISEIPTHLTIAERVRLTVGAMKRGDEIIYQAALFSEPWLGYADFLRRVPIKTRLGDFGYEAVDTKLARSEKPEYIIQLALYTDLIALVQGTMPHRMHVVLGDGRECSFQVSEFEHYYRRAKKRFETFNSLPTEKTTAEPCSHCKYCHWRDICADEWQRTDHLSLVANITKHQIRKLKGVGIDSLTALAKIPSSTRVPRMPVEILQRLRSQAELHLKARTTRTRHLEIVTVEAGRGFERLPKPDSGDIFFDIEGDPLYPEQLEYLFGCLHVEHGEQKFIPIWAHDHAQEKEAVRTLLRFFTSHLKRYPNAHIYHYAAYEVTALKRLTARYAVGEFELDQLLRGRKFVDLYKVVREGLRTSEPNYSIKSIEKFYMPARATEIAAGGDSIVAYAGERIRDKIAASKRKGMFMGGGFPLGYDVKDRELVINETEAEQVRTIFALYLELKSVRRLQAEMAKRGYKTKIRVSEAGRTSGGKRFFTGSIYYMLRNRTYIGEIAHKGNIYEGRHKPIIERSVWNDVQALLADNARERASGEWARDPAPFGGRIFDDRGNRLTPTHTQKGGRYRYRYYACRALLLDQPELVGPVKRVPAQEIETLVAGQMRDLCVNPNKLALELERLDVESDERRTMIENVQSLAAKLRDQDEKAWINLGRKIIQKIVVSPAKVQITTDLSKLQLACAFGEEAEVSSGRPLIHEMILPVRVTRAGRQKSMVVLDSDGLQRLVNENMVLAIARALKWDREVRAGVSLNKIAGREGVSTTYATRIMPLAFLAPDIVEAIYDGRQPSDLKVKALSANLPLDWVTQRRTLGFPAR